MAEVKISQLPLMTATPDDSDYILIVDESIPQTKRIFVSELKSYVTENLSLGIDSASIMALFDSAISGISFGVDSASIMAIFDSASLKNLYDSDTGIRITGSLTVDSDLTVDGKTLVHLDGNAFDGSILAWDSDNQIIKFSKYDVRNLLDSASVSRILDSASFSVLNNLYDSNTGIRITGSLTVDSDLTVAGSPLISLHGVPFDGSVIAWDSVNQLMGFSNLDVRKLLDSAAVISLVDSAYVQSRVTLTGGSGGIDSSGGATSPSFVASGNITEGLVVVLNDDGTVSIVEESTPTFGDEVSFASNTIDFHKAYYGNFSSSGGPIVLVVYSADTSGNVYVKAGTVSGTSITFGAEAFVAQTNSPLYVDFAANEADDNFIVLLRGPAGGTTVAVAGTVSGTTVTVGDFVIVDSLGASDLAYLYHSIVYVPTTNSYLAFLYNNLLSNYEVLPIRITSGTTMSGGTPINTPQYEGDRSKAKFDTYTEQVVLYTQYGEVGLFNSTSNTTVSHVNKFLAGAASPVNTFDFALDGKGNVLLVRCRNFNAAYEYFVGNITTGQAVFQTLVDFSTEPLLSNTEVVGVGYNSTLDKFIIMDYEADQWRYFVAELLPNNTLQLSTPVLYSTPLSQPYEEYDEPIYLHDPTTGNNIFLYYNPTSQIGYYRISADLIGTNSSQAIGIAEQTVTGGESVNVTVIGGINHNVAGLTPNRYYLVSTDGSLVQTTVSELAIGRSLAADKILITRA